MWDNVPQWFLLFVFAVIDKCMSFLLLHMCELFQLLWHEFLIPNMKLHLAGHFCYESTDFSL